MSRPEIVYIAGLQKTGLGSLATMLEKAGYYRTRTSRASKLRNKILKDVLSNGKPDLRAYFATDTLFVDWPAPLLYKEAFFHFGERAKYILSVRSSPEKWLNSLKTHSLTFSPGQWKHQLIYGAKYPHGHEEQHIEYYLNHIESVKAFFEGRDASHLLDEVCIEDEVSAKEMLRNIGITEGEIALEKVNTGEQRLEKFSMRKIYNGLILAAKERFG
jgi:hypothetical protein